MTARRIGQVVLAFAIAVLATTVLGTMTQTQFNLAALQALGTPIPLGARATATGHDLLHFTPSLGPIVAGGFLVAFIVSGLLARWRPAARVALHALAGFAAVVTAMVLMNHLFGITAVAAVRGLFGLLALGACGAAGGWVFARLVRRRESAVAPS